MLLVDSRVRHPLVGYFEENSGEETAGLTLVTYVPGWLIHGPSTANVTHGFSYLPGIKGLVNLRNAP